MHDGCSRALYEVRYAPELKRNLIFIGVLTNLDIPSRLQEGDEDFEWGMTIMRGVLESGLYILVGNTICGNVSSTACSLADNTKLWHMRLAHVSVRHLHELNKQGLLGKDKISRLEFCESCVRRKTCL